MRAFRLQGWRSALQTPNFSSAGTRSFRREVRVQGLRNIILHYKSRTPAVSMMDLQCLSVGVLSTSYCPSNSSWCHPLRPFAPRRLVPPSCISMSLDHTKRTNSRRALCPYRNWVRELKCRSAAESYQDAAIDVEATVREAAVGDEDDDYPDWVEEDDPNWPEDDPDGEGIGFPVDNFFQPKIVNEDGSTVDDDGDNLDVNWEAEQYQWIVREITSAEWEPVAREDPTPLIFFAFERYGPNGAECWKLLEELEKVVRIILDSRRYPIRAVKLDISSEPAVGDALQIATLPCLLFIKDGKQMYRMYGLKTADDLLAITAHVFYHSVRPDCMDEADTAHKVVSISSSGS